MLKNKIWIVALFIALTMAFIGCTDAARDWDAPAEQSDENALQIRPIQNWAGFDLRHEKFQFAAGDIIEIKGKALAKNNINLSRNFGGWNPLGSPAWESKSNADEEFEGKVTLTASDVTTIAGLSPAAIRVYGNTANATFVVYNITLTRGGEEIFNLYEMILKGLTPGETDRTVIFGPEGKGEWIQAADNNGLAAVFTILGPGFGGAEVAIPPSYAGDLKKVRFVDTTSGALLSDPPAATSAYTAFRIEDRDPAISGDGESSDGVKMEIDEDGWATMTENSVLFYKFPERVFLQEIGVTGIQDRWAAVDITKDYDYVDIEYTIKDVDTTSGGGGNFRIRARDYANSALYGLTDGYPNLGLEGAHTIANGLNVPGNDPGSAGNGKAYRLQTWGAGTTGGVAITFDYSQRTGNGSDSLKVKIDRVVYTKGVRHQVEFYVPQFNNLNNIANIQVLDGNTPKLPTAPANKGWIFLGWYTEWNATNQNMGNAGVPTGMGSKVSATTVINTSNTVLISSTGTARTLKLYAAWLQKILEPITVDVKDTEVGGTLMTAAWHMNGVGDDWGQDTVMTETSYDSKKWYVVNPWNQSVIGPWTVGTTTIPAVPSARCGFYKLSLPAGWDNGFNKVKITYDLVMLDADKNAVVALVNGSNVYSSWELPGLTAGNDKELILNIGTSFASGVVGAQNFGFRQHPYYGSGAGAFLWRISKIEIYVE